MGVRKRAIRENPKIMSENRFDEIISMFTAFSVIFHTGADQSPYDCYASRKLETTPLYKGMLLMSERHNKIYPLRTFDTKHQKLTKENFRLPTKKELKAFMKSKGGVMFKGELNQEARNNG